MSNAPKSRSLIAMIALLAGLTLYGLGVMQLGARMSDWSVWLQTPLYLLLGLIWIWPARALLRWAAGGPENGQGDAGRGHD